MSPLVDYERNLSSLYKGIELLLSDEMTTRGSYFKLFHHTTSERKYVIRRMKFGGGMSDLDLSKARASCSLWPMRQFSVPQAHWACFMDRFLSLHHHDVIHNKRPITYDMCDETSFCLMKHTDVLKIGVSRRMKADGSMLNGNGHTLSGKFGMTTSDFKVLVSQHGINGLFPFKRTVAAETKQNVYFDDVLLSLKDADSVYYTKIMAKMHTVVGITNDQACAMVMSHYALFCHGVYHDLLHWVAFLLDAECCKAISDLTKIMGVANCPYLTLYTEADALLGRGSVLANEKRELDELSGLSIPNGHNIEFESGIIYSKALELFAKAMPVVNVVPHSGRWKRFALDGDTYWKERHVNCVNGAHHLPNGVVDYDYVGSKTRMQFLENATESPLFATEPLILATLSWKFENPKVRAIKSEDTYAYLNEDYIMKTVESVWTDTEVLLSPSLGSKYLEGERLQKMPGNVYVMLDYSAMDKQHSIQTQVELIDALCDFLGAPAHVKGWFNQANSNQYLRSGDRTIKLVYSLLTGRRMTTFINTCLNKIYFELACPGTQIRSAMFAGDDIVLRTDTDDDAFLVLTKALASKSVFNPRKQSWGEACEFLRVANKGDLTMCYSNRIIASAVCGNWVSHMRLAETHLPGIFSRLAWMLDNRSMLNGYAAALLTRSLWRRIKQSLTFCRALLQHNVSVDDGPVCPDKNTVTVVTPRTMVKIKEADRLLASNASRDYIGEFVNSHVQSVLNANDIKSLVNVFTRASYLKSLTTGFEVELTNVHTRSVYKNEIMCNAQHLKSVNPGVMASHPTFPALRGQLTMTQMSQVVRLITGEERHGEKPYHEWLFGDRPRCAAANLGNDFDDVAQLCKAPIFRLQSITPRVNLARTCFT